MAFKVLNDCECWKGFILIPNKHWIDAYQELGPEKSYKTGWGRGLQSTMERTIVEKKRERGDQSIAFIHIHSSPRRKILWWTVHLTSWYMFSQYKHGAGDFTYLNTYDLMTYDVGTNINLVSCSWKFWINFCQNWTCIFNTDRFLG